MVRQYLPILVLAAIALFLFKGTLFAFVGGVIVQVSETAKTGDPILINISNDLRTSLMGGGYSGVYVLDLYVNPRDTSTSCIQARACSADKQSLIPEGNTTHIIGSMGLNDTTFRLFVAHQSGSILYDQVVTVRKPTLVATASTAIASAPALLANYTQPLQPILAPVVQPIAQATGQSADLVLPILALAIIGGAYFLILRR